MTVPNSLNWLTKPEPSKALQLQRGSGTLEFDLPEVAALYGVPQSAEHHPEICTGAHIELCLDVAEKLGASPAARFAVLTHDLGKALTPKDELPKHVGHETAGLVPLAQMCDRLAVPEYWRSLAMAVCEHHLACHRAFEARPQTVLRFLEATKLQEGGQFAEDFLTACEADARGRLGRGDNEYPQGALFRAVIRAVAPLPALPVSAVQTREWQSRHVERLTAVRDVRAPYKQVKAETQC